MFAQKQTDLLIPYIVLSQFSLVSHVVSQPGLANDRKYLIHHAHVKKTRRSIMRLTRALAIQTKLIRFSSTSHSVTDWRFRQALPLTSWSNI
jgi:hypothetical protein